MPFWSQLVTPDEVFGAQCNLEAGKAFGPDGVPPELLTCRKPSSKDDPPVWRLLSCATTAVLNVFELVGFPALFGQALVTPIPKDASAENQYVEDYRPISVGPILFKVYDWLRCRDLMRAAEENDWLHPSQIAFQRQHRVTDHLLVVGELMEHCRENDVPVVTAHLDKKQAFDTVDHTLLFAELLRLGVDGRYWRNMLRLYRRQSSRVVVEGVSSPEFRLARGVRQGGNTSPMFFNISTGRVLRSLEQAGLGLTLTHPVTGATRWVGAMLFADDGFLLARSHVELKLMLEMYAADTAAQRGVLNADKSKVMPVASDHREGDDAAPPPAPVEPVNRMV
ncbi:MAG: RNA-directed DNA polymerase, partial [Nitrospira sp.]